MRSLFSYFPQQGTHPNVVPSPGEKLWTRLSLLCRMLNYSKHIRIICMLNGSQYKSINQIIKPKKIQVKTKKKNNLHENINK